MPAGYHTIAGGSHNHGHHGHGRHIDHDRHDRGRGDRDGHDGHGGYGFDDHDHGRLVDVSRHFRPEVMRWLKTYLDGLHDSPRGGHGSFPHEKDGGYGPHDQPHDQRDPFGIDSHHQSGHDSIGGGDDHGGSYGRGHAWHADAPVPAADTSSASRHF